MASVAQCGGAIPLVVGANQRSSSLATRDRLYVEDHDQPAFLDALRREGLAQALVVSTCDRVEVHAVDCDPDEAGRRIAVVLARHAGLAADEIEGQLYVLSGAQAVRHVFAVAASLESTVIGEPHVLGQIKESHRASRRASMSGGELEALMQRAYAVAKRVRSETSVGAGAVSVATATVDLAKGVLGDLDRSACLMIGTGELGAMLADALRTAGLGRLSVTDTRPARADAVARALGCHALPIEELADWLADADIVLGCLGSRTPAVTAKMTRAALRRRRNRPMVFVDTAIPGDIDPLADRLDALFLYTLDDLERVARDGRVAREGALEAARRIVDEAAAAFLQERAERAAIPALERLRGHFEGVRLQALEDAGGDADRATRLLVNRLLHDPMQRLRHIAGQDERAREELTLIEELLGRLFRAADRDDGRNR